MENLNFYYMCDTYQLLHQYHKILAACNIQGERACEGRAFRGPRALHSPV